MNISARLSRFIITLLLGQNLFVAQASDLKSLFGRGKNTDSDAQTSSWQSEIDLSSTCAFSTKPTRIAHPACSKSTDDLIGYLTKSDFFSRYIDVAPSELGCGDGSGNGNCYNSTDEARNDELRAITRSISYIVETENRVTFNSRSQCFKYLNKPKTAQLLLEVLWRGRLPFFSNSIYLTDKERKNLFSRAQQFDVTPESVESEEETISNLVAKKLDASECFSEGKASYLTPGYKGDLPVSLTKLLEKISASNRLAGATLHNQRTAEFEKTKLEAMEKEQQARKVAEEKSKAAGGMSAALASKQDSANMAEPEANEEFIKKWGAGGRNYIPKELSV